MINESERLLFEKWRDAEEENEAELVEFRFLNSV